jgi:putative acetyltransferase
MKTPEPIVDIRVDIIADIQMEALDPAATEVQALVAASDAFYDGLYPEESSHLEALDDLDKPNVLFFGCRVDAKLVASGAAKLMEDDGDYAEIKRVFVLDAYRGQGLSAKVMNYLESELQRRGVRLLRLETGVLQPQALGLYRKLGYCERGPFGAYGADPLSVFMEKSVVREEAACVQNAKPDRA